MSNRVSNCIKMLEILRDGRKYKKDELANLLETNPRNIIEYRKDLFDAGYVIEHQNGVQGGYFLDQECILPSLNLNNNERTALVRAYELLKYYDFFHLKNYQDALIKIKGNFDNKNILYESYINQAKPVDLDIINQLYATLSDAIVKRRKIELKYSSLKTNKTKKTIIHPYELIMYQNFWYLIGRDESNDKQFKIYKLSKRMKEIKILEDQPYYFDEDFKVEDYVGKTSLIKTETYNIELMAQGASAIVLSEKKIGYNPTYEWLKDDTLILRTTIEGKYNALGLILSLGSNAILLKPVELVEEIKLIITNMQQNYNNNTQIK